MLRKGKVWVSAVLFSGTGGLATYAVASHPVSVQAGTTFVKAATMRRARPGLHAACARTSPNLPRGWRWPEATPSEGDATVACWRMRTTTADQGISHGDDAVDLIDSVDFSAGRGGPSQHRLRIGVSMQSRNTMRHRP